METSRNSGAKRTHDLCTRAMGGEGWKSEHVCVCVHSTSTCVVHTPCTSNFCVLTSYVSPFSNSVLFAVSSRHREKLVTVILMLSKSGTDKLAAVVFRRSSAMGKSLDESPTASPRSASAITMPHHAVKQQKILFLPPGNLAGTRPCTSFMLWPALPPYLPVS